jgi:hypothetical protein
VAISLSKMSLRGILSPEFDRRVEGDEAISYTHKELGYLDEKKEKDKKDEVYDEERKKDNSKNSGDVFSKMVI